jgi:hypothetical protein
MSHLPISTRMMTLTTDTSTDGLLRAAILALHADGQSRTIKGIGVALRASGKTCNDSHVERIVRELRSEGLIPGRWSRNVVANRHASGKAQDGERGGPVPWWRTLRREHFKREKEIRSWASKWAGREMTAALCES